MSEDQLPDDVKAALEKMRGELFWLADAPMFIDADRIVRVYDALGLSIGRMKRMKTTSSVIEVSEEMSKHFLAGVGAEAQAKTQGLTKLFADFLAKMNLKAEGGVKKTDAEAVSYNLEHVETPQRQLVQVVLQYVQHHGDRLFFPESPSSGNWRDPDEIVRSPQQLVFLDLPSLEEAADEEVPETKFIPTAAEFDNGSIEPLFSNLRAEGGEYPPKYPEKHQIQENLAEESRSDSTSDEDFKKQVRERLKEDRKKYWDWFDENFRPVHAMQIVEEAASENGRIKWIDHRVPLTHDGDTLHLHVCPDGKYDTGTFAYNLTKRGYKHGVRLVGTLKSEPDMNVLSIYEK